MDSEFCRIWKGLTIRADSILVAGRPRPSGLRSNLYVSLFKTTVVSVDNFAIGEHDSRYVTVILE